jgi:hypothetical protein
VRRIQRAAVVAAGSVAFVFVGGASGITATGTPPPPDDHEPSISGEAERRASRAALVATGGGRVTDTEARDEESYYEVQVTFFDGRHVDVQLDKSFSVVGNSPDGEDDDATSGG